MSKSKQKVNKNHQRRAAAKAKREAESRATSEAPQTEDETPTAEPAKAVQAAKPADETTTRIDIADIDKDDPLYAEFKNVFERVQQPANEEMQAVKKPEVYYSDEEDDIPEEEDESKDKLSKKARKAQSKLSIAELKAIVKRPDLVEWTDVSGPDPRLLVSIKAHRNVVPVPTHWSLKREYLSSKRGVEKPPFSLPKFIQETGIAEMRDAVLEKQAEQTLKQRQRERVAPKMGRLDIDYQKLYEAFFRFQTKPELTRYGEVYYEGKEYETNMKHLRPGELSEELKEALNIPPGAPPPWLINQQRYGPPPSYPALKIQGLNAPPPPGAQWGFHPGGYGKPPVDEFNRPLYGGDIFGTATVQQPQQLGQPVEKTLWGELQAPEESEEEEEEDEEEEDNISLDDADMQEIPQAPEPKDTGAAQPTIGRAEDDDEEFSIRKGRRRGSDEDAGPRREAYQVIQEQGARAQGFFGSDRKYDLQSVQRNADLPNLEKDSRKRKAGDVDISVDMDALARDGKVGKAELQKIYDEQKKAEAQKQFASADWDEDLSAMIADESRKRLKKDEERRSRR